eukprot:TRINITY_DN1659_c0_g1_i5.p1 TRINITY_DN1659_c0_g1~~TRINITY_DN1659_c0_g1_i5.p1  ORF type:complete len:722 (-),score=166.39 TRINITY_DN1659_c0_g1_i5:56-1975(-)
MAHDRFFFDYTTNQYTVIKYLEDVNTRYGGIDSILIWPTYPNIGVDSRNQFDLLLDMPGGVQGLANMIAEFHKNNVRVLFPYNPWDNGTRPLQDEPYNMIGNIWKSINADGVNGDTMLDFGKQYFDASNNLGHPIALEPELGGTAATLAYTKMNWGYWTYQQIPVVDAMKWLEPRHMTNICDRWARDHTDDMQHAFFNGCGFESWENVWGIWNQMNLRDAEAVRRFASIQRFFHEFLISKKWEPHTPVLQANIYASKWPDNKSNAVLYTIVNRGATNTTGPQLSVPQGDQNTVYFDVYHGVPLTPGNPSNNMVTLSFDIEANGYGSVLIVEKSQVDDKLIAFLKQMAQMTQHALAYYSSDPIYLPQTMVDNGSTSKYTSPPDANMTQIPSASFQFVVAGIEIEGGNQVGVDFQYSVLGETLPQRSHNGTIKIDSFYMDKYPVTNTQYASFLAKAGYVPKDCHNFLRDWSTNSTQSTCNVGTYPSGWANKPVTWVSQDDARAFCQWSKKRLPNEWEWQYAAQGTDGRRYPWGSTWVNAAVPTPFQGRELPGPSDVTAHPLGASPFGIMDLVGNVWQWTNEYQDAHTRAAVVRGGCYYLPQGSMWYFPQAYALVEHGKYLLMGDSLDRSANIGFRCAADSA